MTCGKSALVDELTHGFVAGMQNRGYPMRTISIALNMVAKPLWRAYQAEGELGLRHQMERGIMDWLRLAGEEALDRPFEFVTSCVNTAAPLLGSDLNVQWTDDYKGFRLFGYGLGVGTQVDLGKNGFVEDTGVHGSYRLRSTLNTVGVSGCIGTSHEETTMSTADGYLHREMDSHGVRAKAKPWIFELATFIP
ncbi:unnamed protein product, partial [Durusdinium trenchii]